MKKRLRNKYINILIASCMVVTPTFSMIPPMPQIAPAPGTEKQVAQMSVTLPNKQDQKQIDTEKKTTANQQANFQSVFGGESPDEKKDIYLNFENTDLMSFVDYISEIKKLNVIPDKTLEGAKISLTIREPLSIEGAWKVFLTVLEMAGFAIVQAGEVYKIVPKDKKLMQPLPAYINVPYESLPDSDETIRYVMFLTNIQVDSIRPVLESMLSSPNALHEQKDMNAFVIVDKSYNIRAAAKLLTELDQMGLPETVTVLRRKRVNIRFFNQCFKKIFNIS